MKSLWHNSLEGFRARLASAEPAPGGGSAAAVSAALGVGLLIMAAEISRKKKGTDPAITEALPELQSLLETLSYHADRDIAAYEAYVAARKMPKDTQTEMAERDKALVEALQAATEAPKESAEAALSALRLAKQFALIIPVHILSDVLAGAELISGGLVASLAMLQTNIRIMKDADDKARYKETKQAIEKETFDLLAEIRKEINARLEA